MTKKPKPHKPTACMTVGAVIKELRRFPPDTAVASTFDSGTMIVFYNRTKADTHVAFEDNDGTWDEDETIAEASDAA